MTGTSADDQVEVAESPTETRLVESLDVADANDAANYGEKKLIAAEWFSDYQCRFINLFFYKRHVYKRLSLDFGQKSRTNFE